MDDVKGLRIGIPKGYLGEGLDPEVKEAVLAAAKTLEAKGAIVEMFDMDMVDYAIPAYYVIASAEASSNLSRFDGVKYGYRTPDFEDLQDVYKKPVMRLWYGSQASNDDRCLCIEFRLLRCLLY